VIKALWVLLLLSVSVVGQDDLEKRYDSHLDADEMVAWMKFLTARPHHAGSEKVKENAEWMVARLREWGLDAELAVYHVLLPRPVKRELTLLEPTRFEASLVEPAVAGDPTSAAIEEEGLPPFNAYSADGDVTGELVYVNQGLPRDYEELARRGIDVRGKIVIARYGGSWRGIKPKVAAEHGAIGCIIYNDPRADGFYQGPAYPDGPYKHEHAVQRGSVLDLPLRPGDPLTPMVGATEDAQRLDRAEADNVMTIPVLPISYADAKPLMAALRGHQAPGSWRGAMPITYHIGPGPAKVRLTLEFDWKLVPAYNVIAKLEGAEFPDEWVIRGNHHDAWVVGASDPISGIVALLAQAKATGMLAETGWRPKRTLVFCAWDAEEPALLGSTEWVEHHAAELREKAVAYINTDGSSRGFLGVGGSHALTGLVNRVAAEVTDPQTGVSVAERLFSRMLVSGSERAKADARAERFDLYALGSGSDYSAFLQHIGITTLNLGFGGEGRGGEYHTGFDTHTHYLTHKDPGLTYGVALAQVCGRLSLGLSEAEILPFDFTDTVRIIRGFAEEVMALADSRRAEVEARNRLIREGHFERALDPTAEIDPPALEEPVPFLEFARLQNALARLETVVDALGSPLEVTGARRQRVNEILYTAEQAMLGDGLPRRPWFRHQVYAPGFYTGYGVKTLPGIREAIEEGMYGEARAQIRVTAETIERLAAHLAGISATED